MMPCSSRFRNRPADHEFWSGEAIDEAALKQRLADAGREPNVPTLHLRVDQAVDYGRVARAMAWAACVGVIKLGFLTEPDND